MKKKISILVSILFVSIHAFTQNTTKKSFEFGFKIYGLPLPDMNTPMGAMATIGYDFILYQKKQIFSLQPHVGGGVFANKKGGGTLSEYSFRYKYNMGAWEIGLTPKLCHPIIDDEMYAYIANEFSFINLHTKTWDNGKAQSRQSNSYMNFYYTCKIGILIKMRKQNIALWGGYTTIDFSNAINKNRPKWVSAYRNEQPGICFGTSFYW